MAKKEKLVTKPKQQQLEYHKIRKIPKHEAVTKIASCHFRNFLLFPDKFVLKSRLRFNY